MSYRECILCGIIAVILGLEITAIVTAAGLEAPAKNKAYDPAGGG